MQVHTQEQMSAQTHLRQMSLQENSEMSIEISIKSRDDLAGLLIRYLMSGSNIASAGG